MSTFAMRRLPSQSPPPDPRATEHWVASVPLFPPRYPSKDKLPSVHKLPSARASLRPWPFDLNRKLPPSHGYTKTAVTRPTANRSGQADPSTAPSYRRLLQCSRVQVSQHSAFQSQIREIFIIGGSVHPDLISESFQLPATCSGRARHVQDWVLLGHCVRYPRAGFISSTSAGRFDGVVLNWCSVRILRSILVLRRIAMGFWWSVRCSRLHLVSAFNVVSGL